MLVLKCTWRTNVNLGYGSSRVILLVFWVKVSRWDLELVYWVRLSGQQHQGSTCLCLPSGWIMSTQKHAWLCTWVLGFKPRFSGLHDKPFTNRRISPTPERRFLKEALPLGKLGIHLPPTKGYKWHLQSGTGCRLHKAHYLTRAISGFSPAG